MAARNDKYVKILFRFRSDVLDKEMVETMWVTIVDKEKGLYKLDSIPFYAPLVASGDVVFAEFDEQEQMLTYRKTIEYSGNSIVQIVLMDKSKDINQKFVTHSKNSDVFRKKLMTNILQWKFLHVLNIKT